MVSSTDAEFLSLALPEKPNPVTLNLTSADELTRFFLDEITDGDKARRKCDIVCCWRLSIDDDMRHGPR